MADDEIRDKEAADDLNPAFDSIDATMKNVPPKEVTVTTEALAQIVTDAVAKAITAYEQTRGGTPESEAAPGQPAAAPCTPRRTKIDRLNGDLGIDEIEFDAPRAEPVEKKLERELSSQMGVHDFEFEDAPGPAAEPGAPTRTEADAMAGWATRTNAIAGWVTPVRNAAPPETPDIDETPAPAAAEEKTADEDPRFDWVAEEPERLEAEEIPTALDLEPARNQAPEAAAGSDRGPSEVLAQGQTPPPGAPKPEVRVTLSSLANWFRSALGEKPQEREPATEDPVAEPEAPAMPAAAAEPGPPVVAPSPVVARTEEPSRPARDPAAALKPMTPDEAAKTIFFTFDPIPPVPPRLPREPEEPPKKINKSGRFL